MMKIKKYKKLDETYYNFKLPLSAIKRLIRSYFDDIYNLEETWSEPWTGVSGWEERLHSHCYIMLNHIEECLTENGINGEGLIRHIYNEEYLEKFKEIEEYRKRNENWDSESAKKMKEPIDPSKVFEVCLPKAEDLQN